MRAPSWCHYWSQRAAYGGDFGDVATMDRIAGMLPHRRGFAVDGGAHIGTWTLRLSELFGAVVAIEPNAENFALLQANTAHRPNVAQINAALGATAGRATMALSPEPGANSGQWMIATHGEPVDMIALDDLDLPACDFLKLDLEGYEIPALAGAARTIARHRPAILVEDLPHGAAHGFARGAAPAFVLGLGYRVAFRTATDAFMLPE